MKKFFESREWLELRYKVLRKLGFKCQACGVTGKESVLHVDHIKPRSRYPELALEESNLQVLCEDCNLGKSDKFEDRLRDPSPLPERDQEERQRILKAIENLDYLGRKAGLTKEGIENARRGLTRDLQRLEHKERALRLLDDVRGDEWTEKTLVSIVEYKRRAAALGNGSGGEGA